VLDGLRAHVCVIDHAGVIVSVDRAWRTRCATWRTWPAYGAGASLSPAAVQHRHWVAAYYGLADRGKGRFRVHDCAR
jgi:hypothetical protein